MNEPLQFFISTHDHLDGARLSLRDSFVNLPCANVADAWRQIGEISAGRGFTVEVKHYPKPKGIALPPDPSHTKRA